MYKLRCLLSVFVLLVIAQSATAWWWKRQDCPRQQHCPVTCGSGYVSHTDYKGCTIQLCKCKDVCEHFNCPANTRCSRKFHCKRWGRCSVYATCVVVDGQTPVKSLDPSTTTTTAVPTTTSTSAPTTKPSTTAIAQGVTQKTAAPSLCQSGEQHLSRWRCGPQDVGSRPCPDSYRCEIDFAGRHICCPIPQTTAPTTTTTTPAAPVTGKVEAITQGLVGKPSTSFCRGGAPHLAGWYCGRGGERCPSTHKCLIHPADQYAVCCPIPVPDDEPQIPVSQQRLPMCEMPVKVGPCKGSLPRWFFNSETGICESFIYGNCQGNANNFISKKACERACGKPGESYCSLRSETGRCRAAFPRYFYNSTAGQCEEFVYGGCEGNGNNFVTQSQCEQFCA